MIDLGRVSGESPFGRNQSKGCGNRELVGIVHVETLVKPVSCHTRSLDLKDFVPDLLVVFHGWEQPIPPCSIRVNLQHGLGTVDHPAGVVMALGPWQGRQPCVVLVLHLVGRWACQPVFRIGLQILRVAHPAEIVKLMPHWRRYRPAICRPPRKARELGKDIELFSVLLPFLEVLGDHPPAIIEHLGKIFVRTNELGNVLLQERPIIVLFKPTIELRTVAVEVRVAVKFVHIAA